MIAVLGLGFVGLTTALGFSKKGFRVRGFDVDKTKAGVIASGKIPFFEADMQEILDEQLNHNFTVSETLAEAVSNSKVVFLCVGTPSDEKGKADLTYLLTAIGDILNSVQKGSKKIIVVKSTVPPSTTRDHVIPFIESKGFKIGEDVIVANNPEFLREGHAWKDFIEPDRIVIGTQDEYAKAVLGEIYAPFAVPVHYVSLNTGEFIKYLSNTLLSTLISYSNEMSMIAMTIGDIDTRTAFQILHEDKRWGEDKTCMMASYAFPGCGFGGYCLPKDTQAMAYKAGEFGYNAKILKDVLAVNAEIKPFWIEQITENLPKTATIGVLGLFFKPHSDDIRQTPAKAVLEQLLAKGYTNIVVYDPIANDLFDRMYKLPLTYKKSVKEVADCADVVAVVTAWPEFRENEALLKGKKVFDLRYCL